MPSRQEVPRVECVTPSPRHGHEAEVPQAEKEFTRAVAGQPQAGLG